MDIPAAGLLIRQHLALSATGADVDEPHPSDPQVMEQAVAVAGHLFDHHLLWEADLVGALDHFRIHPDCQDNVVRIG